MLFDTGLLTECQECLCLADNIPGNWPRFVEKFYNDLMNCLHPRLMKTPHEPSEIEITQTDFSGDEVIIFFSDGMYAEYKIEVLLALNVERKRIPTEEPA